jgi:tubulin-folding cofactor B
MPDDVYDRLPNTLRAYIRNEREKNPSFKLTAADGKDISEKPKAPLPSDNPPTPKNACEIYVPGSRCEVHPGGRRGEIKYIGQMGGLPGTWIGVDLDEPLGHNDGVGPDGVRYFTCKGEGYGCFAKHYNVHVGEYPELDPFASSDDEI